MRSAAAIGVLLLASLAWATEPSVVLVNVTRAPDPNWRTQDARILARFHRELVKQGGLRVVAAATVSEFFREAAPDGTQILAKRAREHIEKGRAYSARLKPSQAIKEFSEALRILRAIFPHLPDLTDLEEAHLQLGMTYQALGRDRQADRHYRMVLLQNPDRVLDENLINPVVIDRFAKVRGRVRTSLQGSVSLISKPSGARVFMNGKPVGFTPITIPGVLPGEHYFSMEHDGYKTWFGLLPVKPGGLEKREVFLVDGERVRWTRLRHQMAQAGIGKVRSGDAQELAEGLQADWLLLVSISHLSGKTVLELGLFERGSSEVGSLGVFPSGDEILDEVAGRVRRWIQGDRRTPHKTFVRRRKQPEPDPGRDPSLPPPPPPPPETDGAWYEQWWFWTAVGVVVAGAATTTALLLSGDSGIRIEVVR